jgi:hypothetical protein
LPRGNAAYIKDTLFDRSRQAFAFLEPAAASRHGGTDNPELTLPEPI